MAKEDLKKEAKSLGLDDSGSVDDLEQRIAAHKAQDAGASEAPTVPEEAQDEPPPLPKGATMSPTQLQQNSATAEAEGMAEGAGDPAAAGSVQAGVEGKAKDSGTLSVARKDRNSWHCPFCDHASTHTIRTCPKCGAVRSTDGESASRKAPKA